MRIFFSVGEPSGDLHGANLIRRLRQLRPETEIVGYGGPRMEAAGCRLEHDLTELAVMWFWQALVNVRLFWQLYRRAGRMFADPQRRPDAVVLIDYPGFNWWVARAARRHGIVVYYYGVPQVWAWAPWRVRKMRRLVDHVLCKLPFEADWYREHGCNAIYVGHPYYDEIAERTVDASFLESQRNDSRPLVTLLPGSRTQEVVRNGPELLRAAGRALQAAPEARLAAACFNSRQAALLCEQAQRLQLPLEIHVGRTAELIEAAHCCLACSGSVSLELMCAAKPSAILYRMSRFQYRLGQLLVRVKYITLVNLLAMEDRFERTRTPYDPRAEGSSLVPMPEYPTCEDKSAQLAEHVVQWIRDAGAHGAASQRLRELRQQFAAPGATQRAAEYVLSTLAEQGGAARAA